MADGLSRVRGGPSMQLNGETLVSISVETRETGTLWPVVPYVDDGSRQVRELQRNKYPSVPSNRLESAYAREASLSQAMS